MSWGFLSGNRLASQTSVQLTQQDSLNDKSYTNRLLLEGAITSAPLVGIGLLQNLQNRHVRELRFGYYPNFRHHFDDYLQFAPLVAQVGLRLGGLQGTSPHIWQTFAADAFASISMLAITSAIKYTARIERPDGSTRNSFPSGHTAMAFASAEVLNIEYGGRYPWLPYLSYSLAGATGLGRMMNNRHWLGDVVAGAGLGILSAHVGYWITGQLFGDKRYALRTHHYAEAQLPRLTLELPVQLEYGMERRRDHARLYSRSLGLAALYRPWADSAYYIRGHFLLSLDELRAVGGHQQVLGQVQALELRLGAGRNWQLYANRGLRVHPWLGLRRHLGAESLLPGVPVPEFPTWSLTMGLEATPYWRVCPQLALSFPLGLSYRPAGYSLPTASGEMSRARRLHWGLGSSLCLYL